MGFGLLIVALILCLTGVTNPEHTSAAEKSYYSPIINVDVDNSRILVSTPGAGVWVGVPEGGKTPTEKPPPTGAGEIGGGTRGGATPPRKTWKVKSGESTCLHFDGKVCK